MGVIAASHLAVVVTVLTALREEGTALMQLSSQIALLQSKSVNSTLHNHMFAFSSGSRSVAARATDVSLASMLRIPAGGLNLCLLRC